MKIIGTEMIARLRGGEENCLHELYEAYRDDFISWSFRKYQLSEEDSKDIFQNTLIVFYENVVSGKLTELNCEVKTYLFAVGKNQILRQKKNMATTVYLNTDSDINLYTDPVSEKDEDTYTKLLVQQAMGYLGKECQEVLRLFYFVNLDLKKIAVSLQYKNENVVKTKKSQCLRKLAAAFNIHKQNSVVNDRPEI